MIVWFFPTSNKTYCIVLYPYNADTDEIGSDISSGNWTTLWMIHHGMDELSFGDNCIAKYGDWQY
jgi:hypothetical protein